MNEIIYWISIHYIEVIGAILGILGVFFQIKQIVWVWPVSIIASVMYVIVFLHTRLYGLMSLQFYFIAVSVYGWYQWVHPKPQGEGIITDKLPVIRLNLKTTLIYTALFVGFWLTINWFLREYTDDAKPLWGSMVTALSLVASLMLAKKIIEQWFIWIIADSIAVVLYFYQHLYPTMVFYFILVIMAIIGFYQWKKETT